MKNQFVLALGGALLFSSAAQAASLAVYRFDGGSAASTDTDAGSTASAFSLAKAGTDVAISSSTNMAYARSSTTDATVRDGAGAVAAGTYFSFTITPNAGQTINLDTLSFDYGGSAAAGFSFTPGFIVTSSVGGHTDAAKIAGPFTKVVAESSAAQLDPTSPPISLSSPSFQNLTTATQFRIYYFDNTEDNSLIDRIDNVVLTGTATPEPGTIGMLGVVGAGLLLRRRRALSATANG